MREVHDPQGTATRMYILAQAPDVSGSISQDSKQLGKAPQQQSTRDAEHQRLIRMMVDCRGYCATESSGTSFHRISRLSMVTDYLVDGFNDKESIVFDPRINCSSRSSDLQDFILFALILLAYPKPSFSYLCSSRLSVPVSCVLLRRAIVLSRRLLFHAS